MSTPARTWAGGHVDNNRKLKRRWSLVWLSRLASNRGSNLLVLAVVPRGVVHRPGEGHEVVGRRFNCDLVPCPMLATTR